MSGLIKSGSVAELSQVRSIATVTAAAVTRADEERAFARQRIAALEEELRLRDAAIAQLQDDVIAARAAGEAEGRLAGFGEAEDRQAERLVVLEDAMHKACALLGENLSALGRLAPVLAKEALEIILGDAGDRVALLGRMVDTQVARIEKSALLGIELSREDFPDDAALTAFSTRVALPQVTLTAGDLPSGGCVMTLRLGRMNVGIAQQWGVLKTVLDEMAEPEARA
jgi:hypothetical protein